MIESIDNPNYLQIISQLPFSIAVLDTDMRYIAVSDHWIDDYRLAKDNGLVNKSHYDVFPEISDDWRNIHKRALQGESIAKAREPFVRLDGSTQYITWEIKPWYQASGDIGGINLNNA